jgi:hypothetical protein
VNTWLLIAAAAGAFLLLRRTKSQAAAASSASVDPSGAVQVPGGATIGRIGATIENPAALKDFAAALESQSSPRVIHVLNTARGDWYRTWSDGRFQVMDSEGNVLLDTARNPVGEIINP